MAVGADGLLVGSRCFGAVEAGRKCQGTEQDDRSNDAMQSPYPHHCCPSNQASLSRSCTTSPTITRVGAWTSCSATSFGKSANVPVNTRWCVVVPCCIS